MNTLAVSVLSRLAAPGAKTLALCVSEQPPASGWNRIGKLSKNQNRWTWNGAKMSQTQWVWEEAVSKVSVQHEAAILWIPNLSDLCELLFKNFPAIGRKGSTQKGAKVTKAFIPDKPLKICEIRGICGFNSGI
jgi:hypothetical protein